MQNNLFTKQIPSHVKQGQTSGSNITKKMLWRIIFSEGRKRG